MKSFLSAAQTATLSFVCLAPSARALTVGEAVTQGLESNPSLRAAQERFDQADARTSQAIRGLFPTAEAFVEASTRKDSVARGQALFGGDPYNDYRTGLRAQFSLLKGGALWSGIGQVRSEADIARLDVDIERRDLQAKVLGKFFEVSLARRRSETYRGTQKLLQEVLGSSRKRLRMGTERRSAVLQFETDLALTKPKVEGAENELVIAATELAEMLDLKDVATVQLQGRLTEDVLRKLAEDLNRQDARQKRAEIERAEQDVERADFERGVLLAEHWPSLLAKAEWSSGSAKRSELLDATGRAWSVGLEFRVPIFSGLSSLAKRRELAHRRSELELARAAAVNKYALAAAQNEKTLALLNTQLTSSREALDLAREAVRQARFDYDRGLNAYTQLYDSQKNLVEAELAREQSLYDYFKALIQEYVSRGWALDPLIQTLDQSTQTREGKTS